MTRRPEAGSLPLTATGDSRPMLRDLPSPHLGGIDRPNWGWRLPSFWRTGPRGPLAWSCDYEGQAAMVRKLSFSGRAFRRLMVSGFPRLQRANSARSFGADRPNG